VTTCIAPVAVKITGSFACGHAFQRLSLLCQTLTIVSHHEFLVRSFSLTAAAAVLFTTRRTSAHRHEDSQTSKCAFVIPNASICSPSVTPHICDRFLASSTCAPPGRLQLQPHTPPLGLSQLRICRFLSKRRVPANARAVCRRGRRLHFHCSACRRCWPPHGRQRCDRVLLQRARSC
jgi:hypothetical protein